MTAGLVAVLAACSSDSGGGGEGGAGAEGGGVLTIGMPVLPSGVDIDPPAAADAQVQAVLSYSYSGTLFGYMGAESDPNSETVLPDPAPQLAESAELSEDGTTWTVTLRPGVQSTAGTTLTAADVEWTIDRALATEQGASIALSAVNLDTADPTTVVDDSTVEINLTAPSSVLEKVFANPALGIYDSATVKANAAPDDPWGYEWLAENTASYGPYQVTTSELPQRAVFEPNPNYWQDAPDVETVTYVQIAEPGTRLQALITGEIDLATQMVQTDIEAIESAEGVRPDVQTGAPIFLDAAFNLNSPEAGDAAFRQALSLSMDREAMVSAALGGLGGPLPGCMVGGIEQPTTDLDAGPTPDVAAAKARLAESTAGRTITIGFPQGIQGESTIPQILQSNFADIGVTATLKPYTSYPTYLADAKAGVFGVGIAGGRPSVLDAGYFYNAYFTTGSALNVGTYSNPAFDELVQQIKSTSGDEQRTAVQEACELFMTDQPAPLLVRVDGLGAVRDRVTETSGVGAAPLVYNISVD